MPELGRTMAELAPLVKNDISHRALASQAAKQLLQLMLREREGLGASAQRSGDGA